MSKLAGRRHNGREKLKASIDLEDHLSLLLSYTEYIYFDDVRMSATTVDSGHHVGKECIYKQCKWVPF